MVSIRKTQRKDNTTWYRAEVRVKGYPRQSKTFKLLREAKEWGGLIEGKLRLGEMDFLIKDPDRTVASLIDEVVENIDSAPLSDKKKLLKHCAFWRARIGNMYITEVSVPQINRVRQDLLNLKTRFKTPMKPASVNSYLCSIRYVIRVAVDKGWIKESPLKNLKWEERPRPICRYLSKEELLALLSASKSSSSPYIYTVVKLALGTGMRKNEILTLKKSQLNLDQGRLYLYETKEKRSRGVFLSKDLVELLKTFLEKNTLRNGYLFGDSKGKPICINYEWRKTLAAAAIKDFRFHDLRHTCASYLAMNGASLLSIKEVLGHKHIQMTMRYAHLSESHISNVVQKMNDCYLNIE